MVSPAPWSWSTPGTWTVDALYEMCKSVATKVSSGDTMSYEPGDGDIWGMVAQAYDGLAFMWGAEQAMITKDEDDLPIMRILDERNVSAWQTISEMLYDKSWCRRGRPVRELGGYV